MNLMEIRLILANHCWLVNEHYHSGELTTKMKRPARIASVVVEMRLTVVRPFEKTKIGMETVLMVNQTVLENQHQAERNVFVLHSLEMMIMNVEVWLKVAGVIRTMENPSR